MVEPRHFNKISYVDEYTIEKSSSDKSKLEAECFWYENNQKFPAPIIYDGYTDYGDYAAYTMEYIHGDTLSEIFLSETPDTRLSHLLSNEHIEQILYCIYEVLISGDSKKTILNDSAEFKIPITYYTGFNRVLIESLYSEKTYSRLAEAKIDLNKQYIINGKSTPALRKIIEDSPVIVTNDDITYIHGDLCFSNIIWNGTPFFIDPRGCLSDGKFSTVGDIKYDIGKLAHSIIGRYDQIKSDKGFDLTKEGDYKYRYEIETSSSQQYFETVFKEMFKNYDYYNVMIHLFLSMIPLHSDRPDHQEKMLVNAIRLYTEKDKLIV